MADCIMLHVIANRCVNKTILIRYEGTHYCIALHIPAGRSGANMHQNMHQTSYHRFNLRMPEGRSNAKSRVVTDDFFGAGRGGRTPTRLPSADFEFPENTVNL